MSSGQAVILRPASLGPRLLPEGLEVEGILRLVPTDCEMGGVTDCVAAVTQRTPIDRNNRHGIGNRGPEWLGKMEERCRLAPGVRAQTAER